jgi:hypothetical protein
LSGTHEIPFMSAVPSSSIGTAGVPRAGNTLGKVDETAPGAGLTSIFFVLDRKDQ